MVDIKERGKDYAMAGQWYKLMQRAINLLFFL